MRKGLGHSCPVYATSTSRSLRQKIFPAVMTSTPGRIKEEKTTEKQIAKMYTGVLSAGFTKFASGLKSSAHRVSPPAARALSSLQPPSDTGSPGPFPLGHPFPALSTQEL